MDQNYISLSNYHELPHYTNIYSLSTFETPTKRGCIINTSKHIYRLISRKNGTVTVVTINLSKIHGILSPGEIEIQSQCSHYCKGYLYLAYTCRIRMNNDYAFYLVMLKYPNGDIYTTDAPSLIKLDSTPYKIYIVHYT